MPTHLPGVPSFSQLFAFAQLADLLTRLAVQAVYTGTAVLFAKARSAGATFLPPLLLGVESGIRLGVSGRQGEEARLVMLTLYVHAQWGRLG